MMIGQRRGDAFQTGWEGFTPTGAAQVKPSLVISLAFALGISSERFCQELRVNEFGGCCQVLRG
jgi:hypothetical protein